MPAILEQTTHKTEAPTPFPGLAPARPENSRKRAILIVAGVLLTIAVLLAWRATTKSATPAYGTATVQRGSIVKTITATGKLQALTTVQVGTQASGTVSEILADFNSQVKKGQIIARLDPSQFQAQLTQASANLTSTFAGVQGAQSAALTADAGVQAAQANVERLNSIVNDAKVKYGRTQQLVDAGVSPRQDLDTAKAAVDQAIAQQQQGVAQVTQARAQAQSARSQVSQSRAQVAQSQAAVQLANVNMEHTIIRAPIDGVVVSRSVDVGQTVAASLQAPTLFLIANDLTRMQVLADIDEADVGQLGPDSEVTFTVDAFPADTFRGKISQIRLAPQAVQNVVTYTAVIDVPNADLKLKPGMTANVTATVARKDNVLVVPNTALRFRPDTAATKRSGGPTLWRVADDKTLAPVPVKLGLTDGINTEVTSSDLSEGDRIATPAANAQRRGAGAQRPGGNPLMGGGGARVPRR